MARAGPGWYPPPVSPDRVEHRTGQQTTVVARTADGSARQDERSRHAAHLTRAGATGERVLVEEERGETVARRTLGATREPTADLAATSERLVGHIGD